MRRHLALRLPYSFIAQIDLAEVPALGGAAADLPGEGRLLFFYDLAIGPWNPGRRCARVVWDRSPRAAVAPAAMPEDQVQAHARADTEAAAARAQYGLPAPAYEEGSCYAAPSRAMALRSVLRLPRPDSLEGEALLGCAPPD